MTKNNERNLNVTIKNQDDNKDEVVISISAIMRNLKRFLIGWIAIAIIVGLLTFSLSAFKTFSSKTPTKTLVSFTYSGIEKGLDPKGRKFESESMKNPKVIEKALTEMGLDLEMIEDIRKNLSFDYKIPQEAYDQLTAYQSVMDKATSGTLSAAQAMLDTKFYPSQFTVHFDFGKAGFGRQTGVDFLNTLLRCYGDYFYEEYGYNEPLGTAVNALEYESYDYAQQVDLFRNSIRTVRNYLSNLNRDDNTTFRSSVTGYTFNDLSDYAKTISSIDLDRISSYISVNNVTKNKDSALAYYNYTIENLNRDKNEYAERLSALDASISKYLKDTIQVFGTGNEKVNDESTLHSDQYDLLFQQKTKVEASLAQVKQDINIYTSRRDALQNNKNSSKANVEKVEADIEELSKKVKTLVDLTLMIHLGYLAYDSVNETVRIPNEEIKKEFSKAVKEVNHKATLDRLKESEQLFIDTINGNEEAVAAQIEKIHREETTPLHYNKEDSLRSIIKLAYYSYKDQYVQFEELAAGEGYADVAYIPRHDSNWPALIIELKWNKDVEGAIDQILNKKYPDSLKNFGTKIILVGISYEKDASNNNKKHTCKIIEYVPE